MNNMEWRKYFPKKFEPRQQQKIGIQFALNTFLNENKTYCILQIPVGGGKSFIAATLANYFNNQKQKSYILTTQIILQNQYRKQFPKYANISSKNNYKCSVFPEQNCGDMKGLHDIGNIPKCNSCPYDKQKKKFVQCPISITNTAFFMSNLQFNQDIIKNRKLLVIDEAHNLQQQIIKYNGIELNYFTLHKEYGFESSDWIKEGQQDVFKWIYDTLYVWIQDKRQSIKNTLEYNKNGGLNLARHKFIQINRKLDYLNKLIMKLNKALETFNPQRWVIQNRVQDKIIIISPLFASDFSEQIMFSKGDKILLMSGSILNKESYCRNLGIEVNDCSFLSLDSPFPVENRKIYIIGSGSMSKKNIDATMPVLIKDIKKILKIHKQDKGIIHVSSHYIAKQIYDSVDVERLIIANDFSNRDEMLDYHYDSKENTVLISPSLMQGLDLKDDLSRFQIIAKIPFPNLGSKYISTKKDLIKDWYSYQTAKLIVQAYGRSIRSKDDYALTYVLDSDFVWFLKQNKHMFPKYFLEAISYGKI